MTGEECLYHLMSTDSALIALVPKERITQERPTFDSKFPLVFFTLTSRDPLYDLSGNSGTVPEEWTLEIWCRNGAERKRIADALRDRLASQTEATTGVLGLRGIVLLPGEGPLEPEEAPFPLCGWQQQYRVVIGDVF